MGRTNDVMNICPRTLGEKIQDDLGCLKPRDAKEEVKDGAEISEQASIQLAYLLRQIIINDISSVKLIFSNQAPKTKAL